MLTSRTVTSSAATPTLLEAVRRLLDEAFDGTFSDTDWEHTLGGWHATVWAGPRLLAHAAVVPRTLEVGDRPVRTGYVEGVATAPDRRGEGLGSLVMTMIGNEIRRGFELGALSTSRHSFYEHLGWQRWKGPTFVRDGDDLRRTADEDEGIMVLRFATTADLDLQAPIACHARAGDDW